MSEIDELGHWFRRVNEALESEMMWQPGSISVSIAKPIRRAGQAIYKVPEGASFTAWCDHPEHRLCAMFIHPDRRPWLVTQDGREIEIDVVPQ